MTRIMRDSTTATDIPISGTQLVAGYANGRYAWSQAGWDRFKGIPHARIDVNGSVVAADVLDVETGDATVPTAVSWVLSKNGTKPHYPPVIYCNRSVQSQFKTAALAKNLVAGRHYKFWIATLDGTKSLSDMTGVIAIQYAGANITGHHYDQSIVLDSAWNPGMPVTTPTPTPPPVHTPPVADSAVFTSVWHTDDMTPPNGHETADNPKWVPENVLRFAAEQAEAANKAAQEALAIAKLIQAKVGA